MKEWGQLGFPSFLTACPERSEKLEGDFFRMFRELFQASDYRRSRGWGDKAATERHIQKDT